MSIRKWFGVQTFTDRMTPADLEMNSLLDLYKKALEKVFQCGKMESLEVLLQESRLKGSQFETEVQLFLEWFEVQGIQKLNQVLTRSLPDSQDLCEEISYEAYILQEEMDFEYPDDVLSCLVNILVDMPNRIDVHQDHFFLNKEYVAEEEFEITSYSFGESIAIRLTVEPNYGDTLDGYFFLDSLNNENEMFRKENEYLTTKLEESAISQAPLLTFRGKT